MRFIEVVESGTGMPHLIPIEKINCVQKFDPNSTWHRENQTGAQSKIYFGRSLNICCKDRYEDVLRFIREAGGVIADRPEREMRPPKDIIRPAGLEKSADPVNHPPHYNQGPIEVIDIIEGFGLGFHLGNVVKYILRAPHKGVALQDLKKAKWYLDRYIEKQGQKTNGE